MATVQALHKENAMEEKKNTNPPISDGTPIVEGEWYKSLRGHLFVVSFVKPDGNVVGVGHMSGNTITIPPEQVAKFTKAEDPGTACGTMVSNESANNAVARVSKNDNLYAKYPHIIPGTIYQVQNVSSEKLPEWERKRQGKKLEIKGQTRCKIKCIDCGEERDIKIQDAFQVKTCLNCRSAKRKKQLTSFLKNKEKEAK